MAVNEAPSVQSTGIEEAIGKVEDLYRAVTGKNPPAHEGPYAPIPVERDPTRFVEDQMDRLLGMLSSPEREAAALSWCPLVSLWENDREFLVSVDLAGVSRQDVEIRLQDNVLTIAGSRPAAFLDDHRLRASERPFGPFRRQIVLPPALKARDATTQIQAQLKDGQLEIRITKEGTAAEGPKKIPVN